MEFLRNVSIKIMVLFIVAATVSGVGSGIRIQSLAEFGNNCAGRLIPDIKKLQKNLRDTVTVIRQSTTEINNVTSSIKDGNDNLSSRTGSQR